MVSAVVCFRGRGARLMAACSMLALLAACASQPQTASFYDTSPRASANRPTGYDPPGPPGDPWGPYIREAAALYDVPERWIREVMRQESGGRVSATSRVGAMGLLQLMPGTYAELRAKHGLGDDPYHPWDNIMAGTAYIREMYDLFGNPGFLAAYNGGPRRLENYLWAGRGLPDETRNYVARIGPRIEGSYPRRRALPEVYAAAELPHSIPRGPRRVDSATMLALREQRRAADPGVRVASLPPGPVVRMEPIPDGSTYAKEAPAAPVALASAAPVTRMDPIPDGSTYASPPAALAASREIVRMDPIPDGSTRDASPPPVVVSPTPPRPPTMLAAASPPPAPRAPAPRLVELAEAPRSPFVPIRPGQVLPATSPAPRGFSLVAPAQASTLPPGVLRGAAPGSAGRWAVQVGAFASEHLARAAAGQARGVAGLGRVEVSPVGQGRAALHRARVGGLSQETARDACERLRTRGACIVLSPEAQG